jgi:hypothetical protein
VECDKACLAFYLILGVLRLGMALAFMQYLHTIEAIDCFRLLHGAHSFCYYSHNRYHTTYPLLWPDLTQLILACVVLVILSFTELHLIISLSQFFAGHKQTNPRKNFMAVIAGRFVLAVVAWTCFSQLGILNYKHFNSPSFSSLNMLYRPSFCMNLGTAQQSQRDFVNASNYCPQGIYLGSIALSIDSTQIALTTFIDNGALLSANILRPVNRNHVLNDFEWKYFGYGWEEAGYGPFVARNVFSAFLAVLIYAGLAHIMLSMTKARAVGDGFLARA